MMNYKTSDLFRRAKQLADLEGTNFIGWNEVINCINESYIGLYEKLINMGDNSFMSSFRMQTGKEKLPRDFWQLKGVYIWNNGNLQTVNRRADNASIHFTSYELRNGEIVIYGSQHDILVEYYTKPKTLIMPPQDREIDLSGLPEGAVILDSYGHTFVYKASNKLSVYDLDGIKTETDILPNWDDDYTFILKDFVFTLYSGDLIVYNLASSDSEIYNDAVPLVTESGDLYVIYDGYIHTLEGDTVKEFILDDNGVYYVSNDELTDFYSIANGTIFHNGVDTEQTATKIIYSKGKCYYLGASKFGVYDEDGNRVINQNIGKSIGFIGINENTGYGYATNKFNKYFVCPYCEDTVLDFPNTFYFQMLSYLLAISFRCKQGADITLLSSQLEMISQTFEDTLGSDAFQFTRMGNVYN